MSIGNEKGPLPFTGAKQTSKRRALSLRKQTNIFNL